jgi:hypothetical protein
MTSVIIPGGTDESSGFSWGPFEVVAEHTVHDWVTIYTGRNPNMLLGLLGPDTYTATIEYEKARLVQLGAKGSNESRWVSDPTEAEVAAPEIGWLAIDPTRTSHRWEGMDLHEIVARENEETRRRWARGERDHERVLDDPVAFRIGNAVYREIADGIMSKQIPAKLVYLDDQPDQLDLTLCLVNIVVLLAIARHRGDYSPYIAQLLAKEAASEAAGSRKQSPGAPKQTKAQPKEDKIKEAGEALINEGHVPAETTSWVEFQKTLCDRLKVTPKTRTRRPARRSPAKLED